MSEKELFMTINACVDELDFVSARKYMEENIEFLNGHKHRLHHNAQELFDFVSDRDRRSEMLNRKEMNIIQAINKYATDFNIRGFKLLIKEGGALLSKKETLDYLNEDAKALLGSMNALIA
ncbi:hypothetical protein DVB69_14705 [Sporosarcina sp. BI001-red]|uniref:hypothetical protein n=1 Tax=Sporosarcina sp. BI001-red TaxID=2282866 RepID=UPI000E26D84F|nr:hypothetical protein [Sporosarcina sp. BI001-red]REB05520.1 hypothetical protein DVB69_14705 [Sporosarcina sp. BI001-red]